MPLRGETDQLVVLTDDAHIATLVERALDAGERNWTVRNASIAATSEEDPTGFDTPLVVDGRHQDDDRAEFLARLREIDPSVPIVAIVPNNRTAGDVVPTTASADEWISETLLTELPEEAAIRIESAIAEVSRSSARPIFNQPTFLEQLFEQVPINLYVKDTEGRHILMSDHHPDSDEIFGKTDREFYPGDLGEGTFEDDMHILETGEHILDKEEYNERTGEWLITSKVPWYNDQGEIAGIIGVTRDITERKEAEEELQRTNERLAQFASMLSHDLRNPLTVATGRMELLADEREDLPHIETIMHALDRMEQLIEDILLLARTGTEIDDLEPVDLADLVEDCWRTVKTKEASFNCDREGTIEADRGMLARVMENLIRNAIEHGGDDVTIRIGTTTSGFYFADDGRGIDPDDRPHIFEEGYSAGESGTGLGLAIVERIVVDHGWDIEANESKHGGARFDIDGVTIVNPREQKDEIS